MDSPDYEVSSSRVNITPELAGELLKLPPLRSELVEEYVEAMKRGRWVFDPTKPITTEPHLD